MFKLYKATMGLTWALPAVLLPNLYALCKLSCMLCGIYMLVLNRLYIGCPALCTQRAFTAVAAASGVYVGHCFVFCEGSL